VIQDPTEFYRSIAVKPILNASGPLTMYGGGRIRPEVVEVMSKVARTPVNMFDLNRSAGKYIAELIGSEAAFVSGGAAGGLVLQAAACIAGTDQSKIERMPDTSGMNNEIIMQKCQRFAYDQAYRVAGANIVDVGDIDVCNRSQLESGFTDRTAAVAYLFASHSSSGALPFDQVVAVARDKGVPVIVDAANFLPPRANIKRILEAGADMAIFSGGKGVKGPQGAGILCGRSDLIEAAAVNASPNPAVGRGMKVAKEEIIGLMVGLKLFLEEDEEKENARYMEMCKAAVSILGDIRGLIISVEHDETDYLIPTVAVRFNDDWSGPEEDKIYEALADGDPPIALRFLAGPGEIGIDPMNLDEHQIEEVAIRLKTHLVS